MVRSSDIWMELGVELLRLYIKRTEVVQVSDLDASWLEVCPTSGYHRVDLECTGRAKYVMWPGNTFRSPRRSWKILLERGTSGMI